ncbi:AmmeMemoRadiSam system radical SAM enzyme [Patescibacteria group bacterium]|nr:AmmeMemoRadiSam system radical SAM enzyme [Patescibacteria group bacterium]MBU1890739.1 AmmeMemoRadiSam system radical SAM enzyme [Patescibacteria group bacterium]
MKEAILYKKLSNGAVQCQVCNHRCTINKGCRGTCSVRENIDGTLFALTYRKVISEAVDPVEKKPLFHFLPGSSTLSIATLGCNFRCDNCQNWQISQQPKTENKNIIGDDIAPNQIISHALSQKCKSISYTYTEPTVFIEYALETMKLAHDSGLKNIWVSNGFMSTETLELIIPYLDAINIDLKYFDNKSYQKYCGGKLDPILKNLITLKKSGVWVEITTLVIPGISDDQSMFNQIAEFIFTKLGPETPWHISRFSPGISFKLIDSQPTPTTSLEKALNIGIKHGLKYVYVGNTPGHKSENTYCPLCRSLNIDRLGVRINRYDDQGRCYKCKKSLNIINK